MTIYTKTVDFQAKDGLASGNPLKIVKGTEIDDEFDAIAAADATNLKKDGTVAVTGNMPMGTYKFTNLGAGSAATDSANLGQVQAGAYQLIGSVSGVDTITGSLTPAISAYAAGQKFSFVAAGANTGAVTININSLGAKSITKAGTTALASGDIPSGAIVKITYDGTRFQLGNLAATNLSSSATATTQTAGDNSTKIATTAYVDGNAVHLTGNETIAGTKTFSSQPNFPAQSMVRLNTTNGYGSTNTVIRRFTNVVTNQGSDITYADSATNGASFTINTNGVYAISYVDNFNASTAFGISVNSTQLTTVISSITAADSLGEATTAAANSRGLVATTVYLAAGAVIRPHAGGLPAGITYPAHFTIVRVA